MTTKRNYPHRMAVYFNKRNIKIYERIENLSNLTGLSISKLSSMAVSFGVEELEQRWIKPSGKVARKKTIK